MAGAGLGIGYRLAYRAGSAAAVIRRKNESMQRRQKFQIGGLLRREYRSRPHGIVRRRKVSRPGRAWSAHDHRSRDVRFRVESFGVVIGPVAYNRRNRSVRLGPKLPTQVWEAGGRAVLIEQRRGSGWRLAGRQGPRGTAPTRKRRVQYRPRPAGENVLRANVAKLPRGFKGSLGP